jgi:carbon storage regulator
MLYLVRKFGESIIINGDIEIKVMEVKRSGVKLGITFPNTATVLRKELHDRIAAENATCDTNSQIQPCEE